MGSWLKAHGSSIMAKNRLARGDLVTTSNWSLDEFISEARNQASDFPRKYFSSRSIWNVEENRSRKSENEEMME